MATLTETRATAEFLISEASGMYRSRTTGSVAGGAAPGLVAGTILGRLIDTDEANWTVTKVGTGNGTVTLAATAYASGVKPGRYVVDVTTTGATAAFRVTDPDGTFIGTGAVGTLFSDAIIFTIADGAADYTVGDQVWIDVPATTFGAYNPASITGLANVSGILFETAVGTVDRTIVVRDAEVLAAALTYPDSATDAQKATANAALAALGIITR